MSGFFVFALPIGLAVYFAVWAEWRWQPLLPGGLWSDVAGCLTAWVLVSAYLLAITIFTGDVTPADLPAAAWHAVKIGAALGLCWVPVALLMIAIRPWPKADR